MQKMEIEPFVDATKAAEFLNLRPRRLLELAREGSIPGYPIGDGPRRVWRFRLSEIASALGAHAVECSGAAVRTGKGKR
jgi:helix-turn-helix protein